MRILFILACFIMAGAAAYYGQPFMRGNADAVVIIITVMTVFAGFLVAIIAILGDPSLIPAGSWRIAENRRANIEARLTQHIWLFVLYLIAIGLLFAGVLLDKAPDTVVSHEWKMWIERLYLFFGVSSFLFTFALPSALHRFQLARVDAEIERRRREAGIPQEEGSVDAS